MEFEGGELRAKRGAGELQMIVSLRMQNAECKMQNEGIPSGDKIKKRVSIQSNLNILL